MSDPTSRPQTVLAPGSKIQRLQTVPRPVLIGGGLVAGTAALIAAGTVLTAVLNVVVTAVTLGAWLFVIVAFWFFWPVFVYSAKIGRIKAQDALTRANPLEALQVQRDQFSALITTQRQQLAEARGELTNVERQFQNTRATLPPERAQEWEERIRQRNVAYAAAEQRVLGLTDQLKDFDRQVDIARAEMSLAASDQAIGKALSGSTPDLSHTTKVALEQISREIGKSSALLDMALKDAAK